jgi:uncharacterized protein YukE
MTDNYQGSSSFQGMDVPETRRLAGHMQQGAQQVSDMVGRISDMLGSVTWTGTDGQRFSQDWHGTFGPPLRQATDAIQENAADLRRRADQQESISRS